MKCLFWSYGRGNKIRAPLEECGVKVIYLDSSLDTTTILRLVRYIKFLRALITEMPDIVLVDYPCLTALLAMLSSKFFRVPFFMRIRGDLWSELSEIAPGLGCLERLWMFIEMKTGETALKGSQRIITVSRYLKNIVKENLDLYNDKVVVIPIPINTNRFKPRTGHSRNGLVILSVSNFEFKAKIQGILHILPTINQILEEYNDIKYKIAGNGKYLYLLKRDIRKLKNTNRIEILEFVRNIEEIYSSSDIFIYFSFIESLGAVVLEAKASQLPVIINDFGGLPETVHNGVDGYIVSCQKELISILRKLVENETLRIKMGISGRNNILESYSNQTVGNQFIHTFTQA